MGLFDFVGDFFEEIFSWFTPVEEGQDGGTDVNVDPNNTNVPVVYGTDRVEGARVWTASAGGAGDKYLYMALVLSEGEIKHVGEIFIDEKPITDFASRNVSAYGNFSTIHP